MARARRTGASGTAVSDADRIIDATFAAIETEGWRRLSLAAIATAAGLPILRVYRTFPSKTAILCGLARRVDEAILAAPVEAEVDERPRDRVFDLLMRRFDALSPYKGALVVLRRELPTDPCAALASGAGLLRSMRWTLEAAGIATSGLGGVIAVKLTAAAYLAAARVWLRDDSPDLAPTMAALDQRLRGIERWLGTPRRRAQEAPAS
ncbi:MAG TPA: helix-turn-helix domain-containing protein [Stellaceae bacterium]|nr:helix-turn-helix domain-containing protein [Stellaceae bacterium]